MVIKRKSGLLQLRLYITVAQVISELYVRRFYRSLSNKNDNTAQVSSSNGLLQCSRIYFVFSRYECNPFLDSLITFISQVQSHYREYIKFKMLIRGNIKEMRSGLKTIKKNKKIKKKACNSTEFITWYSIYVF